MRTQEFLKILEQNLENKLSKQQVDAQVEYYRRYIQDQIRSGRNEADVLSELGDARMIARTIVDGMESESESHYQNTQSEFYSNEYTDDTSEERPAWQSKFKFYGCLALILVIVVVVIAILTRLFIWLLPAIIVGGLILWLLRKLNGR